MKKNLIKILCGFVLAFAMCCCTVSCSCDNDGDTDQPVPNEVVASSYTFDIDINDTSLGTCSNVANKNTFDAGANVTYNVKPVFGKCVLSVTVDGQTTSALSYICNSDYDIGNNVPLTFSNLSSDHTISVVFGDTTTVGIVYKSYLGKGDNTVELSELGALEVFGETSTIPIGGGVKFVIKPNTDYELKGISIDGESFYPVNSETFPGGLVYDALNNTITVDNITVDFRIHLSFKPVNVRALVYSYESGTQSLNVSCDVELNSNFNIEFMLQYFDYCYYATKQTNSLYYLNSANLIEVGTNHFVNVAKSCLATDASAYTLILIFSDNGSLAS